VCRRQGGRSDGDWFVAYRTPSVVRFAGRNRVFRCKRSQVPVTAAFTRRFIHACRFRQSLPIPLFISSLLALPLLSKHSLFTFSFFVLTLPGDRQAFQGRRASDGVAVHDWRLRYNTHFLFLSLLPYLSFQATDKHFKADGPVTSLPSAMGMCVMRACDKAHPCNVGSVCRLSSVGHAGQCLPKVRLRVFVCLCVCTRVRVCACVYVCLCVRTFACV
jgi:hypothetical protein